MKTKKLILGVLVLGQFLANNLCAESARADSDDRIRPVRSRRVDMDRFREFERAEFYVEELHFENHQNKAQNKVIHCGDVITSNTIMENDLSCPDVTGFAVQVIGDHIQFDGNGHTIVAPQAGAALYVHGKNNSVFSLRAHSATYGIFAYDSPEVLISGCDVSKNQIGIELYAEKTQFTGAKVFGNFASHNSVFGIDVGQASPGAMIYPLIFGNDFSHSGLYAMAVTASKFEYSGWSFNSMRGSANGLYLSQGDFYIHDLYMSSEYIAGTQIFADAAGSVQIKDCDVGTFMPASSSQERTGVDLYKVKSFSISRLHSKDNDMGVRLETESGVATQGSISHSEFKGNDVAGVSVISYDATSFGNINITGNDFDESKTALDIVIHAGTSIGSKSVIGKNF